MTKVAAFHVAPSELLEYQITVRHCHVILFRMAPDCDCISVQHRICASRFYALRKQSEMILCVLWPIIGIILAPERTVMARRRKREDDWIGVVAQLVGLMVLLSLISPQVRQMISAVGLIAICFLCLAVVGLIGFGIYRFATRAQRVQVVDCKVAPVILRPSPLGQENRPQTSPDLIEQLQAIDWFQFEKIVGLVYRKLGYSVTRRGGANPDGGIDLVIEKDGQRLAVQCKQWKTWNVGVKAVREFLGALTDVGIPRGIFITLRGYTGEARLLAEKHGIEIVNEVGLAQMLESTDAKFDPETVAILRDDRKFCPKCEKELVLRTANKGPGAGQKFWGCSGYPKCRFTMQETPSTGISQ